MSIASALQQLRGRVAIVTGASSGLGRATAIALAAEGVRIVATGRDASRLASLVEEIKGAGGACVAVRGDAALAETAEEVLRTALETYQQVDVLVNNAGQGNYKSLVETTPQDFDELMNSNMRSTFLFSRAVAPQFMAQRSGTLVFVSSVAGLAGAPNEAVYSATKFAQVGFAQSVDEELRPYGIKICTVCPGGIKSRFAVGRGRNAEDVATSSMMEAAEVADAIVFACAQPKNVRVPQMIVRHMGTPRPKA